MWERAVENWGDVQLLPFLVPAGLSRCCGASWQFTRSVCGLSGFRFQGLPIVSIVVPFLGLTNFI